jgi:phage terminase Nu1 subunit (DNA packaging protein)
LTSWKQIAAHLGKGVRTVQRWERDLGLPVRRRGGQQSIVAFPTELNEWFQERFSTRCGQTTESEVESLRIELKTLRQQLAAAMQAVGDLELQLMSVQRNCETTTSTKDSAAVREPALRSPRRDSRYSFRRQVAPFPPTAVPRPQDRN